MKNSKFYLFFIAIMIVIGILVFPAKDKATALSLEQSHPEPEEKWEEKEFEVTMYTLDECGKSPNHPWYGITASGEKVLEGKTVAASPEIPFGTKIEIPGFEHTFSVEDRGAMIKTHRGKWEGTPKIDIYTENKDWALEWGRQKVKCRILLQES